MYLVARDSPAKPDDRSVCFDTRKRAELYAAFFSSLTDDVWAVFALENDESPRFVSAFETGSEL
jgi:hypothetical protein